MYHKQYLDTDYHKNKPVQTRPETVTVRKMQPTLLLLLQLTSCWMTWQRDSSSLSYQQKFF